MRALDLFCCAGGASMGIRQAGFEVHGVDREPQPEYPFTITQADALDVSLDGYDFVWASPPCQGFTAYRRRPGHVAPCANQIPAVRAKLEAWGGPYVIENVIGAPLEHPFILCGSMFGLDVRRHRQFEANFHVDVPKCNHSAQTPRFACATNRTNKRSTVEVGVYRIPLAVQRKAMGGLEWMSLKSLSQAVPPAYAKHIGRAAMQAAIGRAA